MQLWDEAGNIPLPEPPPIDEKGYSKPYDNWPSAEGFEKAPANWKPRSGRELPALRCTFERTDGSRCKNFGVRGTGFNGTPAMCFIHGGSLPNVKKKAEATLAAARMRLVENTGLAVETLIELTDAGTADAIRLKASTEILDRVGIKGGMEIDVKVDNAVKPSDIIQEKLRTISERTQAKREEEEAAEADATENQIIAGEIVDKPEED